MSFDNSRYTFNPWNNYAGVVMGQGRVQLDSDWNEWLAEMARRIQAGTLDIVGRAVYPASTPNAFYISATSNPSNVLIGEGRMYVDGLLAENHGLPANSSWDPSLAELSGTPAPPGPIGNTKTNSIPFTAQTMYPGATLPTGNGPYLFYLDVWERSVTWLSDAALVDKAVGVDTAGRLQTVWQVRSMDAGAANASNPGTPVTCQTLDSAIAYPARSFGRLTNGVVPNAVSSSCCLTDGTGYTGLENQFYRVEIHVGGQPGTATFKWSRENASVVAGVTGIASQANNNNKTVAVLTVTSLGRDQVIGFTNGNWIELTSDTVELNGQPDANGQPYGSPGELYQIDYVEPSSNSIFLTGPLSASSAFKPTGAPADPTTRIRRWDQAQAVSKVDSSGTQTTYQQLPVGSSGDITVPSDLTTVLVLENGVTVKFDLDPAGKTFLSGDFWTFAARTFDGSVDPQFTEAPPRGIHHHYTKLSVVTFQSSGTAASAPDCRTPWASGDEGDCGCCTFTVGDNVNSFGNYTSIQTAIDNLPTSGPVIGGEICILPGQYYENLLLNGLYQVTLRGSGPQTVLYAKSAEPAGTTADNSGSPPAFTTQSGVAAVVTISNSQHIELTGFTIEAPPATVCILLDRVTLSAVPQAAEAQRSAQIVERGATGREGTIAVEQAPVQIALEKFKLEPHPIAPPKLGGANYYQNLPAFQASATDVTLTDLVLTASNAAAIVAVQADVLTVRHNRVLMQNVASLWAALYVSGSAIAIEDNWIGLTGNPDAANFATAELLNDLGAGFTVTTSTPLANGGIQVGGYSTGVAIVGNTIEGGAYNAISLGGILLNEPNVAAPALNGLFLESPVSNSTTTLMLPALSGNFSLAADGPVQDIVIEGNTISNIGLCGIGPVGFFANPSNLTPEFVGIANLSIVGNTFTGTLQSALAPLTAGAGLGYGVICLPDLQQLVIRDNIVTDFGSVPGAPVCGIFLLNGEQVEISRNRIAETRDWAAIPAAAAAATNGLQAGIGIATVAPPALNQTGTSSAWNSGGTQGTNATGTPPLYTPGLPALRIEQNVVRVALGNSLNVTGYGPFVITGNQFSTGGTVPASTMGTQPLAINLQVMNLGKATDWDTPTSFTQLYASANTPPTLSAVDNDLADSTSGTIVFTGNVCQTETRGSGAVGIVASVLFTLDHLMYANNLSWMVGSGVPIQAGEDEIYLSALMDSLLLGVTLQVTGNRFQEPLGSVLFSAMTVGLLNVTSQNISTFCMLTSPATSNVGNLNYMPAGSCPQSKLNNTNSYAGPYTSYKLAPNSIGLDPADKVDDVVQTTDATSASRLGTLTQVHQSRVTQVDRIATTIAAQSGATSTQAVAANAAVASTQAALARVNLLKVQVATGAPAVTATGWALYGHVYNSSKVAVDGYSVYFVDSTNTYQSAFGIAYTGADGSYKLVYAGPAPGTTTPTTPLFVQVGSAAGDPVFSSTAPFTPTPGFATYRDIVLPAGEKPLGKLPTVLRPVVLPVIDGAKPEVKS